MGAPWRSIALSVVLAATGAGCAGGGSADRVLSGQPPPGPTHEFVIPGGDNTVQYFGREGSVAEREEASAVVAAWMRARAAKDWRKDCRFISQAYKDNLVTDAERVSKGKARNCHQALAFFGPLASGNSINTMTGPIDSLRVGADISFAQYHGRRGIDWIVPLEKEGSRWKVAVSAPINRRR